MSDVFKCGGPTEAPGGGLKACKFIVHATDLSDFFASNSLNENCQENVNAAEKLPLNRGGNFSSLYSCYDDDEG